jgi:hypothetical protein
MKIINSTSLISVKINIKIFDQITEGMAFVAVVQTLD